MSAHPAGWIRAAYGSRPGLEYVEADGCDLAAALTASDRAVAWVREHRRPAFLHLRTVRLMGHAGSDVEAAYRSPAVILDELHRDPLVRTARWLVDAGIRSPDEVLDLYEAKRREVMSLASEVCDLPRLASPGAVMAPLALPEPSSVAALAGSEPPAGRRAELFGGRRPELEGGLTLAQSINRALADVLAAYPESLVFGEDVADKGGVYGVTRGLARKAGRARVFDTLLDEQSVLGLALGAGVSGLLPIPEIQYLAYLHNAEDQLRGEAATLRFFSGDQLANPMVVRIAAYGYQKGFGGHFHNDNAVGVLRDVPGLVIASPSRPDDAAAMLRTCVAAAGRTGPCRCSSSPSRCTTPVTSRGARRSVAGAVQRPGGLGGGARTHRPREDPRRWSRPDHRDLRQRGPHEPEGRSPPRPERGHREGAGPSVAGPAAGRGHDARGRRHGPGPGRRRDASLGRGVRGGGHGAG